MMEEVKTGEFEALLDRPDSGMTTKYRSVFMNPMGMEVLTDIMEMCHFGSTLDSSNPQQIGEYNIGVAILARCGIFGGDRMLDIVRSLVRSYPTGEKEVVK